MKRALVIMNVTEVCRVSTAEPVCTAWVPRTDTARVSQCLGVAQRWKHQRRTKLCTVAAVAAPVDTAAAELSTGVKERNIDGEHIDWQQQWCELTSISAQTLPHEDWLPTGAGPAAAGLTHFSSAVPYSVLSAHSSLSKIL